MYRQSFSRSRGNRSFRPGRGIPSASIASSKYIFTPETIEQAVPAVITHAFADFALDERLKKTIAAHGYVTPTPIQDQTIPVILENRDVVGIANTGTGKTAAFLLPTLHKILQNRANKVVIMAPTRELAVQIQDEFRIFSQGLNIFSALCIGGGNLTRQIWDLKRNPNVLICTPGRLKDLINRKALQLESYKTVILDEVDRMVDIGFIKDITYILAQLPVERQSLYFSATLSREVDGIIRRFSKSPVTVSVKVKETSGNVHQDVVKVRDQNEKLEKLHELLRKDEFKKVLIFGRTKWNVERLAVTLQKSGFFAASIHGNKSQGQRMKALSQFKQNQMHILVATDVAARGLDIDDVSHVINFDEPATYEDYVHRIGRTGRANKMGKALTFVQSY